MVAVARTETGIEEAAEARGLRPPVVPKVLLPAVTTSQLPLQAVLRLRTRPDQVKCE